MADNEVKFKDDKKKQDPFAEVYGTPTSPVAPTLPSLGLERFTMQDWERRAAQEKAAQDALKAGGTTGGTRGGTGRVPTNEQIYGLQGYTAGMAVPPQPGQVAQQPTSQQIAAAISGTSAGLPDYSAYRAALSDQAQQLNAQIQAMYNQLADEAGANVARLEDIYGGASTGIGNVYGSAAENVGQAYASSQQQAADQLARLGIEAAAPAVVNPAALSQAEALSALEQGKASGQAAAERYGAAAGGFGSQMAQVAQQQGTEMNAAILAALQNRLADSLLMEEQGRMAARSGGGAPSVPTLTPYQEAQLAAGAQEFGVGLAQWEQEQARQAQQDLQSNAFRLMEASGISYDEAIARLTGQAPAQQESGGFWNWLNTPLW